MLLALLLGCSLSSPPVDLQDAVDPETCEGLCAIADLDPATGLAYDGCVLECDRQRRRCKEPMEALEQCWEERHVGLVDDCELEHCEVWETCGVAFLTLGCTVIEDTAWW